ncbi:sulfatase-like hydrolase/transferase [Litoreibacter albidus]|uniref:Phosphoglycerol transferase n=1 Tax=Litoreibacter albidus TaxID=670155 RepID=A0A1H2RPS5_9RHOB|nr:sulfatase-like hydrolase/transferase [Litoreibacter albidus]SDW21295.1 phosphoglycerol transferase [Litoreibacter albidus]
MTTHIRARAIFILKLGALMFPAVIAAFLILRARFDGDTSDMRYATVVALLFGATLFVRLPVATPVTRSVRRRISRLWWIVPIVLILPITVVSLIFGRVDVAAFVFHWVFGTRGVPIWDVLPFVVTAITYWVVIGWTIIRLDPFLCRFRGMDVALGLGVLLINPLVTEAGVNRGWAWSEAQESLAPRLASVNVHEGVDRPNIVFIFMEGLEQTYEEDEFGDAYAPIARLRAQGVSFTNVAQIAATGWSLAGTVATQCGAPLVMDGLSALTAKAADTSLVAGVTCLSDLTAKLGYSNMYVAGTELIGDQQGYFGYVNFFDTHGHGVVVDRSVIANQLGETGRVFSGEDGWGYRDDVTLSQALRTLDELRAAERPYFLTVATMDTHGPRAFMGEACNETGGEWFSENIVDAVRCSARLIEDFVSEVRARTAGTNTKIVLMSDHLAHRSNSYVDLMRYPRRNTVLFLDDGRAGEKIEKLGSMVDVFPTVLDSLGWLPEGQSHAGLGTSLLKAAPTLLEQYGLEALDSRIMLDTELSAAVWREEITVR